MLGHTVNEFLKGSSSIPVGIHFKNYKMETTFIGTYQEFLESHKKETLIYAADWEEYKNNSEYPDIPEGLYLVCLEIPFQNIEDGLFIHSD